MELFLLRAATRGKKRGKSISLLTATVIKSLSQDHKLER